MLYGLLTRCMEQHQVAAMREESTAVTEHHEQRMNDTENSHFAMAAELSTAHDADITALHASYSTEKEDEARKKEADITAIHTTHKAAVEGLVATAESKTRNTLIKDHEMALWSATKEAEARSLSDQRYDTLFENSLLRN